MGQHNGNKKALLPIENTFCVILMWLKNLFGLHTCQSIIQDVIFHVNQSIMPCNNAIHNVCLYASMSAVNMCQCSIYLCHMALALAKKEIQRLF